MQFSQWNMTKMWYIDQGSRKKVIFFMAVSLREGVKDLLLRTKEKIKFFKKFFPFKN